MRHVLKFAQLAGAIAIALLGTNKEASAAWRFEDARFNGSQDYEYILEIYVVQNGVPVLDSIEEYSGPFPDPSYPNLYYWLLNRVMINGPGQGATVFGKVKNRYGGVGEWYDVGTVNPKWE